MKFDEETGGKRKLSKRKDPELSLDYYRKDGYHPMAIEGIPSYTFLTLILRSGTRNSLIRILKNFRSALRR